jgi:hypothetical protein
VFNASTAELLPFDWHGEGGHDLFGCSVAAIGNTVAIGAPYFNGTVGAAYLYNGLTGAQITVPRIDNPGPNPGDLFGSCVTPFGSDELLIAATRDNTRGQPEEGAVYLYDVAGQSLPVLFRPPTPTPYADFGKWVVAVGDKVLIGAQRDGGDAAGAAYLFDANGNLLHRYPNPDGGGYFGHSVGALDSNVLITDYNHATYLFRGTAPWDEMHQFPQGGDVCVIGNDVLIRPDGGTTRTLYNGDPPDYEELGTISGTPTVGPGMAALGNDIVAGDADYVNGPGRVYLRQGIPEPSTLALLPAAVIGLAAYAWRRRKSVV